MKEKLDPDRIVKVVIPYFLQSLMRIERERVGLSQREASTEAGWNASAWGALERGAKPIEGDQWRAAATVLTLGSSDIVKRLNGFLTKYPSIWLEKSVLGELAICERPVTSPRLLRSGNVVNIDLNPIRPNLYHELSTYCSDPTEIIAFAVDMAFYAGREVSLPASSASERRSSLPDDRREKIIRAIQAMPLEKFGLLERVVDKFEKYSAHELAQAYQHFSLSVKKR